MADEEDEILRWEPELGEDITVLSAEFCDLFGGCEQCPGWYLGKPAYILVTDFAPAPVAKDRAEHDFDDILNH
jgi:hypothetical protein